MNFYERINHLLESRKLTQTWLADQISMSVQTLSRKLRLGKDPEHINSIAKAFNVSVEWLLTGKDTQTEHVHIPVLTCAELKKNPIDYDASSCFLIEKVSPTPPSFAYYLDNTSMEPLFPMGTLLVFNNNISPETTDYVIAKFNQDNSVYFRQYVLESDDVYLNPVNTAFKQFVNPDITILGVLTQARLNFRNPNKPLQNYEEYKTGQ